MHYDEETDILSWPVAKGKLSHAKQLGNIIIHLSASGKPLLVEILDASKLSGQFDKIKTPKAIKAILGV
jgi:hypothetical protein